jgi:hypothetical protein
VWGSADEFAVKLFATGLHRGERMKMWWATTNFPHRTPSVNKSARRVRKRLPARSSLHIASIVTGRFVKNLFGMKSLSGLTYPESAFQIDVAVHYPRCSLPAEHVANRHLRLRSTFVGSQPSAFVLLAGRHAQSAFARSLHWRAYHVGCDNPPCSISLLSAETSSLWFAIPAPTPTIPPRP